MKILIKKQDIDANAINLVHKNTPTVFKNYVKFEQTPLITPSTVEVLTDESIVSKGYVDQKIVSSIDSISPKYPITHIITKDEYEYGFFDWEMTKGEQYYCNMGTNYNYPLVILNFQPVHERSHFTCSFHAGYTFDTNTTGEIIIRASVEQWEYRPFNGSRWKYIYQHVPHETIFNSNDNHIERNPLFPFHFYIPPLKIINGEKMRITITYQNRTTKPIRFNTGITTSFCQIVEIEDPI